MADIADDAQEQAEKLEDLRRRQSAARGVLTPKDSADNCEECGLEIPSARQIAVLGCDLCIICAEKKERRYA